MNRGKKFLFAFLCAFIFILAIIFISTLVSPNVISKEDGDICPWVMLNQEKPFSRSIISAYRGYNLTNTFQMPLDFPYRKVEPLAINVNILCGGLANNNCSLFVNDIHCDTFWIDTLDRHFTYRFSDECSNAVRQGNNIIRLESYSATNLSMYDLNVEMRVIPGIC